MTNQFLTWGTVILVMVLLIVVLTINYRLDEIERSIKLLEKCEIYPISPPTTYSSIKITSGEMIKMYDPYTATLMTDLWEKRMSDGERINFRLDVETSGTENICVEKHGGIHLDLITINGQNEMKIFTEGVYTDCWIIEKDENNEWGGYLEVDMIKSDINSTIHIETVNTTWYHEYR